MSTTATPAAPAGAAAAPTGPTPRDRALRIGAWAAVVVVGLLLAVLTAAVGPGQQPSDVPLDPSSTTGSGSRALVRVLGEQGTEVTVVSDADRIGSGEGTVLVDDSAGVLAPSVARRIARTAADVVLVTTDPGVLEAFGLDARPAGASSTDTTASTASCAIPAARDAGTVSTAGVTYATDDPDVVRCVPSGTGADRRWGLLRTATPAGHVTVVGTTAAFRNDTVTRAGNAALALGLLGSQEDLVWYVPTAGGADAAPSLGDLAPPWVPSAIGVLGVVAVAAAVWRGRRLGPLVVEHLPVVVRAAETTEGRARLAVRVRDRTHTLDTLRIAAVRRIGRQLGLPRSAHVDEVVRRTAAGTGRPVGQVGAVLVGGPTGDDRALVAGATALDDLEDAVGLAVSGDVRRASRTAPPRTADDASRTPPTGARARRGPRDGVAGRAAPPTPPSTTPTPPTPPGGRP
ncbi:DUF4350 domain-containing protein [Curtobacterium sp. MCPF17_046]|uniref:DUF4350 domain-containing protein n=1 Tax=Curtobacterium sp. MCPF17_046 TaxID=2175663 RepID=UPI000D8DC43C|nr:DUF4350 domain-containing protein [Curtobacterium sp. MCPF17_046]PYY40869.1 DUF4350 domain-containing protein [Curtobacterium sp. MCPF17_046]